jgi:hypothetical protein
MILNLTTVYGFLEAVSVCGSGLESKAGSGSAIKPNSGAFEAQNGAVDAQNGGVEALNGGLEGLYDSGRRFASP